MLVTTALLTGTPTAFLSYNAGSGPDRTLTAMRPRQLRLASGRMAMAEDIQLTVLCSAADVGDDIPLRVAIAGTASAVFRVGGRHYVTQDACTHGPGSLAEGYMDGEDVEVRSTRGGCTSRPAVHGAAVHNPAAHLGRGGHRWPDVRRSWMARCVLR
jgi:nitrite reductase/ring-hydroxylating ferredoxin subunit